MPLTQQHAGLLDDERVYIPCPSCGAQRPCTIGWLKRNIAYRCTCSGTVQLPVAAIEAKVGEVELAYTSLIGDLRERHRRL